MDKGLTNLDTLAPVVQAAWEHLQEAEDAAQAAREHLIAVTNREASKRRTRDHLRLIDGGGAT